MSTWLNGHYHGENCPPPRIPEDGRTYKCDGVSWLPVIEGHEHVSSCRVIFSGDGSGSFTCDGSEAVYQDAQVRCSNKFCALLFAHDGPCNTNPDSQNHIHSNLNCHYVFHQGVKHYECGIDPSAYSGIDSVNSREVRTTSSTGGEKGTKPERFDLVPIGAMSVVAQLYGKGAQKYAAHNWRKGYEWSKSYAALQRHANAFWDGEDLDPEMQLPHMASVVFHALALITFMTEQPGFDDRYKGLTVDNEELFAKAIEAMNHASIRGEENEPGITSN